MVGERYRDLIDAADTIVTMARSAAEVMGSVTRMQQVCGHVDHTNTASATPLDTETRVSPV